MKIVIEESQAGLWGSGVGNVGVYFSNIDIRDPSKHTVSYSLVQKSYTDLNVIDSKPKLFHDNTNRRGLW